MAGRIRSLLPELLDDEVAAALSDGAWRMVVSLVLLADDLGNVRFGDRYVAANVWQDTTRDVARPRDELIAAGVLAPYAVQGQRYAHIVGWDPEHDGCGRFRQRLDNKGKPRVPTPGEDDGTWDQGVSKNFAAPRNDSPKTAESRRDEVRRPPPSPLDLRSPISIDETIARGDSPRGAAKKRGRGTRLAEDWRPSQELIDKLEKELGVDALESFPSFQGFWLSKTGSNATKLRWDLTYANWVREDANKGKLQPSGRAAALKINPLAGALSAEELSGLRVMTTAGQTLPIMSQPQREQWERYHRMYLAPIDDEPEELEDAGEFLDELFRAPSAEPTKPIVSAGPAYARRRPAEGLADVSEEAFARWEENRQRQKALIALEQPSEPRVSRGGE